MHAYVVNLDKEKQRWIEMKKEFKGSGINLRRFSAIKDTVGGYGLIQSFIAVIKEAQEKKLKHVLILEDDIHLTKGWSERWSKICKWLHANPTAWDIYSGGGWGIFMPHEIAKIDDITLYDPLVSLSTHWLYINSNCYNSLINFLNRVKEYIKLPIVGDLFALDNCLCLYKTLVSYPFVAYQKNTVSSIKNYYRKDNMQTFKNAEKSLGRTRKNVKN